jgi:hypothetical protein
MRNFLILFTLLVLQGLAHAGGAWEPWSLIYGDPAPSGGIDLRYKEDKGTMPSWSWEFRNHYKQKVYISFTWVGGSSHPYELPVEPDGVIGWNNSLRATFPDVHITGVRFTQQGSTQSGNPINGELTFPGKKPSTKPTP